MNEIKCPNCGTVIKIDESIYAKIVKQVRDKEFNEDLKKRLEDEHLREEQALELQKTSLEQYYQDKEYKLKEEYNKSVLELKQQVLNKDLETKEILSKKDKELVELKTKLDNQTELVKSKVSKEYQDEVYQKEKIISQLQSDIMIQESKYKLELQDNLNKKDKEIGSLQNTIENTKNSYLLKENNLKEAYEEKLKLKDEQIAYYKDFKAKQSTKMIGESLEVHCNNEFNKLRPLFPKSYFEKDNDCKNGSKGDFIFRDYDDEGTEITSIMFEMKNEADKTASKHKNEDFFKELDKDRKEKNCEYAVLVSMLEIDNDYYNEGIVDVSYKYPKMYVIRPQFFIPIITLIRGMGLNTLEYKKEIELLQKENIDISHFEENMNSFKESFGRNYRLASDKFKKAIEEIDKTIEHLQKTKENLLSSDKNLRIANDKAEGLSIKKLTSNSKTVREMFENLEEKKQLEMKDSIKKE
mgnify:FL=1